MSSGTEDALDIAARGFGSAGAGNRTGRKVGRFGAGRQASTPQSGPVDRAHKIENKGRNQARLDDPTKQQLEEAMRDGFCWWCGATHTKDGNEIQAWGAHWSLSHELDLQHVRDILEVPKNRGLVTPALHRKLSKVRRETIGPEHLAKLQRAAHESTKPRKLSSYGRKVQTAKLRKARRVVRELDEAGRAALLRGIHDARMRNRLERSIHCEACGCWFTPIRLRGKHTRTTCSDRCHQAMRTAANQRNNKGKRQRRICSGCGQSFWLAGSRRTCSDECAERAVRAYQTCEGCGREFWYAANNRPGGVHSKSCSRSCESLVRSKARGAGLEWRDIRFIRKAAAAGLGTQAAIGGRFNISVSMVSQIVRGKAWPKAAQP